MKRFKLLSLTALLGFLTSCTKMSDNGALDGMWQLMEVACYTPIGDSLAAKKDEHLYWCFDLQLMSIRNRTYTPLNDSLSDETLGRFHHTGDSLFLTEIYRHYRAADERIDNPHTRVLRTTGIDGNQARFRVVALTGETLVLQSVYARLRLRKL